MLWFRVILSDIRPEIVLLMFTDSRGRFALLLEELGEEKGSGSSASGDVQVLSDGLERCPTL